MTIDSDATLHQTLKQFFTKYKVDKSDSIAVAASGGPDSMALAHSIIQTFDRSEIYLLCVDHGLRASAVSEIEKIQQWVQTIDGKNISFHVLHWEGDKPDKAVMEAARFARYDLLNNFCEVNNISSLFVGHHQDDQAETFLMRLINGSGVDGLASIQEKQEYKDITIYRPFLIHSKSDLVDYCDRHNVPYSKDPSNENDDYLRPRLRQSMDILAGEGLTSKRLAGTAKRMTRARQALETLASQIVDETLKQQSANKITVNFSALKQYPDEIAFRVLKHHIEFFRPEENYHVRMEKLEDLFESFWSNPENFKPRTLGGCKISLDKENETLSIEKE